MPELTKESFEDQKGRLEAMAYDHGTTWDLSENDQAAIKAVLAALNEARTSLALVTTERDHALKELAKQDAENMQGGEPNPDAIEDAAIDRIKAVHPEARMTISGDVWSHMGFRGVYLGHGWLEAAGHESISPQSLPSPDPEQLGENHHGNK